MEFPDPNSRKIFKEIPLQLNEYQMAQISTAASHAGLSIQDYCIKTLLDAAENLNLAMILENEQYK